MSIVGRVLPLSDSYTSNWSSVDFSRSDYLVSVVLPLTSLGCWTRSLPFKVPICLSRRWVSQLLIKLYLFTICDRQQFSPRFCQVDDSPSPLSRIRYASKWYSDSPFSEWTCDLKKKKGTSYARHHQLNFILYNTIPTTHPATKSILYSSKSCLFLTLFYIVRVYCKILHSLIRGIRGLPYTEFAIK